jgi:Tol biopolymer transport system component
VFSSTRDKITSAYDTSYLARLYIATSEGKNVKKLSDNVGATRVTWGASGRFFYYEAYKDNKQTEYIRSFYDTTKGTNLEIGEDANAVILNSKGTSAAYVTTPSTNGVYTSIITTLDLLSGARKVVQADIDSFASDKGFSFSADDTTHSYETQPAEGRKRFTINLSTGAQEAVALQTYDTRTYTISPDGTKKAFLETRDGKNDLFIVDAAGQNEKRVTTLGVLSPAAPVTWDATGRYLSFAVVKDGETALYIVSVGGGEVRKIVDFSADPQSIPYY